MLMKLMNLIKVTLKIKASGDRFLRSFHNQGKHMRFATILLTLLLISATAIADTPKAIISGPTGGTPGDIIILDASGSIGTFFKWAIARELPDGRQTLVVVDEKGKKAILASLPGQHEVWLAVGNEEGIDLLKYVVTISGGPTPGPTPGPMPNPQPRFPDSKLGVSQKVYDAVKAVPNAAGEAQGFANAFRGIASQISAGTLSGKAGIMNAIKAANDQVLNTPEKNTRWTPFFKSDSQTGYVAVLPKILSGLAAEGKLSTNEDFRAVFLEFAVAFEAVR